jgi:hypothetical protein
MSGTFQLDGQLFPTDPIRKRWSREEVARSGVGEGIYPAFWRLELEFPTLDNPDESSFFYDRWTAGGLHSAVLPHPRTGQLVGFTGVNIAEWAYDINDVDANTWGEGPRLTLDHVSMSATGTA